MNDLMITNAAPSNPEPSVKVDRKVTAKMKRGLTDVCTLALLLKQQFGLLTWNDKSSDTEGYKPEVAFKSAMKLNGKTRLGGKDKVNLGRLLVEAVRGLKAKHGLALTFDDKTGAATLRSDKTGAAYRVENGKAVKVGQRSPAKPERGTVPVKPKAAAKPERGTVPVQVAGGDSTSAILDKAAEMLENSNTEARRKAVLRLMTALS